MTNSALLLAGSALGLFLVGANAAFITNLVKRASGWFLFKTLAVMLLMVYVTLSLTYGDPAPWRAALGTVALVLDLVALGWMWKNISDLQRSGVVGYIPIGQRVDPESDQWPRGVPITIVPTQPVHRSEDAQDADLPDQD